MFVLELRLYLSLLSVMEKEAFVSLKYRKKKMDCQAWQSVRAYMQEMADRISTFRTNHSNTINMMQVHANAVEESHLSGEIASATDPFPVNRVKIKKTRRGGQRNGSRALAPSLTSREQCGMA